MKHKKIMVLLLALLLLTALCCTSALACDELSRLTRSEQVQVIGTKFVLYRETHAKPKEKRIALVKDKKKKTV